MASRMERTPKQVAKAQGRTPENQTFIITFGQRFPVARKLPRA